jgi:hypothetical protein
MTAAISDMPPMPPMPPMQMLLESDCVQESVNEVGQTVENRLGARADREFSKEKAEFLATSAQEHFTQMVGVVSEVVTSGVVESRDDAGDLTPSVWQNKPLQCVKDFNVVYDRGNDTLMLYVQGAWQDMVIDQGVRYLLTIIQQHYWVDYERYLVRRKYGLKDQATTRDEQRQAAELLRSFYLFLRAHDLPCFAQMCEEEGDLTGVYQPYSPLNQQVEVIKRQCMQEYDVLDEADDFWETCKELRLRVRGVIQSNTERNVTELRGGLRQTVLKYNVSV